MRDKTHFANILLTKDIPMGRMHAPKRKKGDWYHSISVFANENIDELPVGSNPIECFVIHFFGHKGSPVLSKLRTTIKCVRKHVGKKMYVLSAWGASLGVIGDIRTCKGYEKGFGSSSTPIDKIISVAFQKWGYEQIPYAHQRNESYNCVAFVDDILVWAATNQWNKRIIDMHSRHGLYIE
jgi:hypothetical protein